MPGQGITAEQRATVIEAWRRLGVRSAVERETGISRRTVGRILAEEGEPDRAQVHARACAKAEREARSITTRALARVEAMHLAADPSDPVRYAAATRALLDTVRTIRELNDSIAKRAESVARTELIRKGLHDGESIGRGRLVLVFDDMAPTRASVGAVAETGALPDGGVGPASGQDSRGPLVARERD